MNLTSAIEQRVLIVAPSGHDAANASHVLGHEGVECWICRDVPELCLVANDGAGALLVTQEALTAASRNCLMALLESQPPWSDIPVVLLANGGMPPRPGSNRCARFPRAAP